MNRTTIDFGIDLGTTNSAIAMLEGTRAQIIKNNSDQDITPSVINIDKNGVLRVGFLAKQRLEVDPEDTYAEFKLQMGTNAEYRFNRSGRVMVPEELSAEVLKSLRADVQQRLGEDLQAAVITVPAAFELPQCDATSKAAQLAGFKSSPLIMEPTAAAMAHAFQSKVDKVFWLVYDFGGGTFDAAVIQIREGTFRIINHAGDNHLGGKLIDWEIVEKLLAPAAAREHRLSDFTRGNNKWRKAFAKLKWAAEAAKINLSRDNSSTITIDYLCNDEHGEPVAFEYDLTQGDVARLAEPYIQRTITIAKKALEEEKLGPGSIQKVILVGGPTLAPYLREQLSDSTHGLGIPLDFSIDPLTVVAQGAAIFAGTQRLDGAIEEAPIPVGEYRVELKYEPMGADLEPVVGGRIIASDGTSITGSTIEFTNPDAQPVWKSGRLSLGDNGSFMTTLLARPGRQNTFRIELFDSNGRIQPTKPDNLKYTVGVAPGAQILIHSLGVALANNEVLGFFEKGATLPARQRRDLKTATYVHAGASGESVRIPLVEGQNPRADRNKLIGSLAIEASGIRRDLPAGSDLEFTLEIDESRLVKATAFVPMLDQEFEKVLQYGKEQPDVHALEEELGREKRRLEKLREQARESGDSQARRMIDEKIEAEHMVDNVDTSLRAASGDRDAGDKAQNRLLDLKATLDEVEDQLEWPSMVQQAEKELANARSIVNDFGDADAKRRFEQLSNSVQQAIAAHDPDQLRQNLEEINRTTLQLLVERPEFWVSFYQHLQERRDYMRDQTQANRLFSQGDEAIQKGDLPRLKATVQQLLGLLPVEQRAEVTSAWGSGVIR